MDLSNYYESIVDDDVVYLKAIHKGYRNLYISGVLPVSNNVVKNLKNNNIDVVVTLTENGLMSIDDLVRINNIAGIEFFHYKCLDDVSFDMSKWFNGIYEDLKPHLQKNILFQCMEGKSRSTTALISVVLNMFKNYMKRDICYTDLILDEVRKERSHARPNEGFMEQLHAYEKKLKDTRVPE